MARSLSVRRGALGSLVLKVANIVIGLLSAIVLARVLGAKGYGNYAYVMSLVSMMAVPAQFGLPNLVIRETARAHALSQWSLMRGLWQWSTSFTVGSVVVLVAVAWILTHAYRSEFSSTQLSTFYWGLVLLPLIALGNLRGAALQGLRRVVIGKMPEMLLRPGLLLLAVLLMSALGTVPDAAEAMATHALAAAIAFVVGVWCLRRYRPPALRKTWRSNYQSKKWFGAVWPLALTAGMQQINQYTDLLMLGIFQDASAVGVYRVAVQGAIFVAFGLQVAELVLAPYFARCHAQEEYARLQNLISLSGQAIFFIAIPVFLLFIFQGKYFLELLFGEPYRTAYLPLLVLSVGQLINASFGSVGFLLNMTGYEQETARGVGIAAISNIVLNLAFIPVFGLAGAALATATTLSLKNFILWRLARRQLNIETFVLVNFFKKIDGS